MENISDSHRVVTDTSDTNDSGRSIFDKGRTFLRRAGESLEKAGQSMKGYRDGEEFKYSLSFGKRASPVHGEIIDIRNPSKTIICTYERQPRLFLPLRNANGCFLRCLLPNELKQIQGFPADYVLCGKAKDHIVQIGNAVPPPLIELVVRSLL